MTQHAATTAPRPGGDTADARASRARRRLLVSLVPFVLIGVVRAAYSVPDLGVLVAVGCFVAPMGLLAVVLAICSAGYQRGMRTLAAAAGPGAWATVCTDVR